MVDGGRIQMMIWKSTVLPRSKMNYMGLGNFPVQKDDTNSEIKPIHS